MESDYANETLKVGQKVMVYWGYGSGFRREASGEISKIFDQTVRVKLLQDVASPYDPKKIGWQRGYILNQIPKNSWHPLWKKYENMVEPIVDVQNSQF